MNVPDGPNLQQYLLLSVALALAAIKKYCRLSGLNNRYLFFTVLEAGSPRSGFQHGPVLGEGPLPRLQLAAFLLCPHVVERERALVSLPLLIRALIP